MADSIFFTTLDDKVKEALEARKAYHGATERDQSAHNWLFRKYAVVTATATIEKTKKSASLTIPTKGGLGRTNQSGQSFGGLYQGTQPVKSKASFDGGRYFPKPHITNVTIKSTGTYGSTRECEMEFAVYTLNDLNSISQFLTLGAKLEVMYGWSVPSSANGPSGKFDGTIYNFSYQLNANGGFDCTTMAMEKGINILPGNINAANDSDKKREDALGFTINADNITNDILIDVANLENLQAPAFDETTGIGIAKFPASWDQESEESSENADNAEGSESTKPPSPYYITLESLIKRINGIAMTAAPDKFKDIQIQCDNTITKGLIPYRGFVSANPLEVIFPGYAAYTTLVDLSFGPDLSNKFKQSAYVDLSKTMINVDWCANNGFPIITTQKGQESTASSVSDFLKKVFDLIYTNSGNKYKLSLTGPLPVKIPLAPNKNLVIIESTFCDIKPKDIYEFTAVTQNSICRNITLAAEVPDAMQTAIFIGNKNNTYAKQPFALSAGDDETDSKTAEPKPQLLKDAAFAAINASGPLDQTKFEALYTALIRENTSKETTTTEGAAFESIVYPLNLQLTIDGIEGIIFGNAITCNYLPKAYSSGTNPKIAFTVTSVDHTISGGDWTTTINTVMRSVPTS